VKKVNSTLSLTSALEVGGWLTPRPANIPPGKRPRCPFYKSLDGPQGRSGRVRKIPLRPYGDFILFCLLYLYFFVLALPSVLYRTTPTTQASMTPAEFEPATPVSDRPQTLVSDRSATGIGRIRSPDRPSPNESLYRLSYPGLLLTQVWCGSLNLIPLALDVVDLRGVVRPVMSVRVV
jgi:hypothetical protein